MKITFNCVLIVLATGFCCPWLNAQTPAAESVGEEPVATADGITSEALKRLQKNVEDAVELDDEPRKKLLSTLQKASDALSRAVKLETQAPADLAAIEDAALTAKGIQAELKAPVANTLEEISEDSSLSDLMAMLATRQPRLQESQLKLSQLEVEPERLLSRRAAIVGDQATHAKRLAEIERELKSDPPADESPLTTTVRRALLLARLREVTAESPALRAELSKYDADKAADLSSLRIQRARKEVSRLAQEVKELNILITEKRGNDARYIAAELRNFAAGQDVPSPYQSAASEVRLFEKRLVAEGDLEIAAATALLAGKNVDVTGKLAFATKEFAVSKERLAALRALKAKTQLRIDRVGLTGAIGLELRRQLHTLSDSHVLLQQCRTRQETMRDLEFERLELEDQAIEASAQLETLYPRDTLSDVESIKLRLAHDRYEVLTSVGKNSTDYFHRLGELDVNDREYIREIDDYRDFIGERVLWIRSNRLPDSGDLSEVSTMASWFLSPNNWNDVRQALWEDIQSHLGLYVLIVLLVFLLFLVQPRFRDNLIHIGKQSARPTCREFTPTVRAVVLTVVIAIAWPVLPGFLSWRLLSDATASPFALAVGRGLLAFTVAFLTLSLLRALCRSDGLGAAHFDWPVHTVKLLRARLHALMIVWLPLIFIESTLHAQENPQGRDAFERLLFVISLLVLAHFQHGISHPGKGVFRDYFAANTSSWVFRLRWVLFGAMVGLPIFLAVLAIVGYFYTAYELSWRLHVTSRIVIVFLVLRAFLIRWFVVNHRELRIEQARIRRQTLIEEQQQAVSADSNVPKPLAMEDDVDLQTIGDQTQRFIDSGIALVCLATMWFVWVNVLPALGVLDRWELWTTTVETTVEFTNKDGVKSLQTEPRLESVTVADALIAIMIGFLTATAARNIPGLLEMAVLQRLPMEPAGRYASRMIARYLIVVIGTIAAAGAMGVGWAQVQWLAAALTVGLGFGLQEIFANFVSGLIILFERPVRIGDVVTIGDVSGTVSRIQIRATTIVDWDRKEYIVPNKEFVTGRLLNWTLSDNTNRVLLRVGVAYGASTEHARELLLKVAKEHSNVLDDPSPVATFEGFGDSTLDLVLRAYLPNLDNRLGTITELHEAVNREFNKAGIEISFPQRDLHVRTMPLPSQDNRGTAR